MTTDQPSFLDDDDVVRELAAARRRTAALLEDVLTFSTIFSDRPWVALEDLLDELRASVTTVATLEQIVGRRQG